MAVLGAPSPDLKCRPIQESDWEGVVDCLRRGFPMRSRNYWKRALTRLSQRPAVDDFPRYGFALETSGRIVGVVLTLYARYQGDEIRCNISSWSVDAAFRPYAMKLIWPVLKRRDVTYTTFRRHPRP